MAKKPPLHKKPVYRRIKNKPNSHTKPSENTTTNNTVVEPSEKYARTIECIKAKGFFVDGIYGTRVYFNRIKEFRVDGKDIPVFVATVRYKDKKGNLQEQDKVYRIVRYNDQQIIGIVTNNHNYGVLKKVKVNTEMPNKRY